MRVRRNVGAWAMMLAISIPLAGVMLAAHDRIYQFPDPPWCPTCYIESLVDLPAKGTAATGWRSPVPYGQWYIAGWAFMCEGGRLPDRYEVWYSDDEGWGHRLLDAYFINRLPRPDVDQWFAAYKPQCAAPANAGYHLYMPTPVPRGARRINVNIWYGEVLKGHEFWVTVY